MCFGYFTIRLLRLLLLLMVAAQCSQAKDPVYPEADLPVTLLPPTDTASSKLWQHSNRTVVQGLGSKEQWFEVNLKYKLKRSSPVPDIVSGRKLKDVPKTITLSFAYRTIDLRSPTTVDGKVEFTLIPGPRYQELANGVPKKGETGIRLTTKFEDKKDITLASATEWTKFEVPWDLRGIIRRIEHAKGGETVEFLIDLSEANGKIQLKDITLVPSN